MKNTETPTRLFDIMTMRQAARTRRAVFRIGPREMYAEDYIRKAEGLSKALLANGLQRGEAVALIAENCPEWNVVDMAVLQAGGVLLPLCPGLTAEEYVECLSHASVRIIFLDDAAMLSRFKLILPQVDSLQHIVLLNAPKSDNSLDTWVAAGMAGKDRALLERRRSLVTADDVCMLNYTGGGTYRRVTHREVIDDVMEQAATETNRRQAAAGNNALCTLFGHTKNYVCQWVGRTVEYPVPAD